VKGFVRTPETVVDLMVDKLFEDRTPSPESIVLDPGCGEGAFISGIVRWCNVRSCPIPQIVAIESNPEHVMTARERFVGYPTVDVRHADFLTPSADRFDYVVGNPPYVPITDISEIERSALRKAYSTAQGRFDLYLLFFEQALRELRPGGRLVFVTPEKYLYVDTARPLRRLLAQYHVSELHFLPEDTFPDLVTYPLVSCVDAAAGSVTKLRGRHGNDRTVSMLGREASWLPIILDSTEGEVSLRLVDVCTRISCGVATGADSVFVVRNDRLESVLRKFARPTVAGRELSAEKALFSRYSLLTPYSQSGDLLEENELGALWAYLREPSRRERLLGRTCVKRKPWYAFHETPPLEVLKPKLLCKDITADPFFVADRIGDVIPRHSVYYIVPRDHGILERLGAYLNSAQAQEWLRKNCQRAANGFLRLQSRVLQRLPLPAEFQLAQTGPLVDRKQARTA
jgi:adenine-specific DNA-methyltransferase